jgi:hypothetical protein
VSCNHPVYIPSLSPSLPPYPYPHISFFIFLSFTLSLSLCTGLVEGDGRGGQRRLLSGERRGRYSGIRLSMGIIKNANISVLLKNNLFIQAIVKQMNVDHGSSMLWK